MKKIILSILVLSHLLGKSQVFTDNKPINSVFDKIVFANLPEPKENRKGVLFYDMDTSNYNDFVIRRVKFMFNSKQISYDRLIYKKRKFRYLNYNIQIDSISYFSDSTFQKLKVNVKVSVYAEAYKRKFNLWHFKFNFSIDDTIKVYSGYINLIDSLASTDYSLVKTIITANAKINLNCSIDEMYNLNIKYDINTVNNIVYYSLNFDDTILRENKISMLNLRYIYFEEDIDDTGKIIFWAIPK